MISHKHLSALLSLMGLLIPASSYGQSAPAYIPVQGSLTTDEGGPQTGTFTFVMRLYGQDQGGIAFYAESQDVTVETGLFTAYLGDGRPADLGDGTASPALDLSVFASRPQGVTFLGITIDDKSELSPRLQLGSVPFAGFSQLSADTHRFGGEPASAFQRVAQGQCPAEQAVIGLMPDGQLMCAASPGPQGVQGPVGAKGTQGISGESGPAGPRGEPGPAGDRGLTGATGLAGSTGAIGSAGSTGIIGPAGLKGATGSAGSTGVTGPAGPAGPVGPFAFLRRDEFSTVLSGTGWNSISSRTITCPGNGSVMAWGSADTEVVYDGEEVKVVSHGYRLMSGNNTTNNYNSRWNHIIAGAGTNGLTAFAVNSVFDCSTNTVATIHLQGSRGNTTYEVREHRARITLMYVPARIEAVDLK